MSPTAPYISSSPFPAMASMSSAKRKFVVVLPPTLTDPSWSSKASVLILLRKVLKRISEIKHPCLTSTVVLNHSPKHCHIVVDCAGDFAVEALYDFNQVGTVLMLYCLIVDKRAACHTLSNAFLKSTKT